MKTKTAKLTYTAKDWALYGDHRDGLYKNGMTPDDVAAALNAGMEQLIAEAESREDIYADELLEKYSDYGAADTEGFAMVEHILDKVYGNGGSY